MKERVFSGIQPTGGGVPHLGNYLGAIRNYVRLQDRHECIYCVVDMHATTVAYEAATLPSATRRTAAALLACGVDPERALLFRQSAVHEHAMLAQVLTNVASMGVLERMTQFKDKSRADEDEGEQRSSIGAGLLMYPVLMAADILAYRATLVPVGDDQRQHLQLCRQLARSFNARFSKGFFREPREIVPQDSPRIMSLRDPARKMSKSSASSPDEILFLDDTADEAARKIRRATSEADGLPSESAGLSGRPAAASLVGMLAAIREQTVEDACAEVGGGGFADLKRALADAFVERIVPIGERMREISRDGCTVVDPMLASGAEGARSIAAETLADVYRVVGFT